MDERNKTGRNEDRDGGDDQGKARSSGAQLGTPAGPRQTDDLDLAAPKEVVRKHEEASGAGEEMHEGREGGRRA